MRKLISDFVAQLARVIFWSFKPFIGMSVLAVYLHTLMGSQQDELPWLLRHVAQMPSLSEYSTETLLRVSRQSGQALAAGILGYASMKSLIGKLSKWEGAMLGLRIDVAAAMSRLGVCVTRERVDDILHGIEWAYGHTPSKKNISNAQSILGDDYEKIANQFSPDSKALLGIRHALKAEKIRGFLMAMSLLIPIVIVLRTT